MENLYLLEQSQQEREVVEEEEGEEYIMNYWH